jgi:hypothetical protein
MYCDVTCEGFGAVSVPFPSSVAGVGARGSRLGAVTATPSADCPRFDSGVWTRLSAVAASVLRRARLADAKQAPVW